MLMETHCPESRSAMADSVGPGYNRAMMKALVLVAALAACGKSDAPAGGAGAEPAARCAEAATKAVAALPGGSGAGEIQAKLQGIITARCQQDKWSAATIECYATTVKSMADMKRCRETLPPDQQQALMGEIRQAMMSQPGAGGAMPPHGGGGGGMAPPPN